MTTETGNSFTTTRRNLITAVSAAVAVNSLSAQTQFKGRLRPGLVAYSYRYQLESKKMTYEDVIRLAADLGFEGLDTTVYWFPDTSHRYLANLRRTAYINGISLYSAAVRVHLCQPTAELRDAELATAKKWIDVAELLGSTHVRVFGGAIPNGATESQAIDWAVETLKRAADYSGEKGIIVGVEDDGGLTGTAEPTIEILRKTNSPWAGMNLDSGNFPKNGYAQVEKCIPFAVSTHIKSTVKDADGRKEAVNLDRLFGMFAKGGYRGFVSLEYEEKDAETVVPGLARDVIKTARKYAG